MSRSTQTARILITSLGLAVGLVLAYHGVNNTAPAFWHDGETHYLFAEELVATAGQVREALWSAAAMLLPLCLGVLLLPPFRKPTPASTTASITVPGVVFPLLFVALFAWILALLPPTTPGSGSPDHDPLSSPYSSLVFFLLLLLPMVGLAALGQIVGWLHRGTRRPTVFTLHGTSIAVCTALFSGLFLLFLGQSLHRAPHFANTAVTVLAVERLPKHYKSSLPEQVTVWVTPWEGLEQPQPIRLLDSDWMDVVEPGTTLVLEWVTLAGSRLIRSLRAEPAPPTAWLDTLHSRWIPLRGDWKLSPTELRLRHNRTSTNLLQATTALPSAFALEVAWNGLYDGGLLFDLDPLQNSAWAFIVRPAHRDYYWIRLERGVWQSPLCQRKIVFSDYLQTRPETLQVTRWGGWLYAGVRGQALLECPEVQISGKEWGIYLYGIEENLAAKIVQLAIQPLPIAAEREERADQSGKELDAKTWGTTQIKAPTQACVFRLLRCRDRG